jgi:hypothetical protein
MKRAMISILVLFLFLTPFVYAATPNYAYSLQDGAVKLIDMITATLSPIFNAVIGDYTGNLGDFSASEVFFIRILIFIILFVVINASAKKIPLFERNNLVVFIISLSVSIIAVRFMSKSELIIGVLLPYGTLGVVITTILPFLIFFYLLHKIDATSISRRLAWGLFGTVFLAIWISKSSQLSDLSNWIYVGVLILVVLVFLTDRGIHRYFALHENSIFYRKAKNKTAAALQEEYLRILNLDTPDAKNRRRDIEDQLRKLGARVP